MENQFADTVHDFFVLQNVPTRAGILEYYTHNPPEGMFLFWSAREDPRLSEKAKQASVVLDEFFLRNKNNFVSFELAHRQTAKLFKRNYLNVPVSEFRR